MLVFHLVKVVLHRFAVKIKKQLEGENSWLANRAEQPQTSHPGREEEGRDSPEEPRVGFQHSAEDKMLVLNVFNCLGCSPSSSCLVWPQSPAWIKRSWIGRKQ